MTESSLPLTQEQITELRVILKQLKTKIEESLIVINKNCEPVALDPALFGRLSRMDAIQQQKMAEASKKSSELRLQQVEAALIAIEKQEYGECKVCGENIAYQRLKVRPESFICIACKQERES